MQREPVFDALAYLPISGVLTVAISSGRLASGMGGKVAGKWNPYVCACGLSGMAVTGVAVAHAMPAV